MDTEHQSVASTTPHPARGKQGGVLFLVIVVVLGLTLVGSTYEARHRHVVSLTHTNAQLASQAASLKANLQKQTDINNGTVSVASTPVKAGVVSMVNGAITFTLPQGWTQTPASGCAGGATIDNQVLCYDVANITTPDKAFSAGVAVYQYKTSDGTARQWVENGYFGPLNTFDIPFATVLSDAPINGDSAFSYTLTESATGSQSTPDYVDATYVVVHGTYAVVVEAQVEQNGYYGQAPGVQPYDYRQKYQPLMQQFIQSVKFKD